MDYESWQSRLAEGDEHALMIEACDSALTMIAEQSLECEVRAERRRLTAETKLVQAIRHAAATSDITFQDVVDLVDRLRATTAAIHENAKSA